MRILVVDDDEDACAFLKTALKSESFSVDTAFDGSKGLYLARINEYDLIILDNVLPKKTGFEITQEIRAGGNSVPILMISVKSEIDEKAMMLNLGVDDYLTKPYSYKELVARARAILRRGKKAEPEIFEAHGITLNTRTQEVKIGETLVYLTRKEFALLELLMQHKGNVVSRGMILEHVWDMNGDPFSKTIETHVVNLRKKIENPDNKLIINIPGRGYKIAG